MAESEEQRLYRDLYEQMEQLRQRLIQLEQKVGKTTPPQPPPPPPSAGRSPAAAPQQPALGHLISAMSPDAAKSLAPAPLPRIKAGSTKTKPVLSLEEWIGMRGFLVIAAVLVLVAAVWFFQYALAQGWITPLHRIIAGAICGLVIIGVGEWTFRKKLPYFAAGLFGIGVVWLYYTVWAASPNGVYAEYDILGMNAAFILMCAVTVLGVFLSARSGFRLSAIISLVGAFATPALLSTGENRFVELMSYMLAVNIGFCVLAAIKRWGELTIIALAGAVVLFLLWGGCYFDETETGIILLMTAVNFAVFYAYAFAASILKRTHDYFGVSLVATTGPLLTILWYNCEPDITVFMLHSLALLLAVYVICMARRWHCLRYGAVIWTITALCMLHEEFEYKYILNITWSAWYWGLYAAALADTLVRSRLAWTRKFEVPDTGFIGATTGLMFAVTYALLRENYMPWMGLYAASLGVFFILLMWATRRLADRRTMAYSFLGIGLTLITLAIPIQFDNSSVTIAWAIQGAVAAFLARRLKSRMLLVKTYIVLTLSLLHYQQQELPHDPLVQQVAATLFGIDISWALLMGIGLSIMLLLVVFITSWRKPSWGPLFDMNVSIANIMTALAAVVLYLSITVAKLPSGNSLWWWLTPAVAAWAVGLWRRWKTIAIFSILMLMAVAARWVSYDSIETIIRNCYVSPENRKSAVEIMTNWFASAGILLGIVMMSSLPLIRKRLAAWPAAVGIASWIVGALLLIWTGSHEIVLYFGSTAVESIKNPHLAFQMSLSIWWAICATVVLIIGFARQMPPARYLAIVIFAVTLFKVLVADMQGVQAVYRILSFMGLGILMLTGSWLYHRYFRKALSAEPANPPPENK